MSDKRNPNGAAPPKQEQKHEEPQRPLWQRLGWLVGIWLASVLTLTLVAYLLRLFMSAAGMQSTD